jgi:ketosteroid isomerase-like protein
MMGVSVSNPRTVFERLLAGIGESRWTELADLYAEDAVVDQPFMAPRRERLTGRATIRAHFEAAASLPLTLRPHDVVVHTTDDPETIIAEFQYDVSNAETGRSDTVANIQVLRIRDGLIVATRDYHDHLRLAATSGYASQLAAALG